MNDETAPAPFTTGQNHCFGCGPGNETGLGLVFARTEDGVVCQFRVAARFEGPPGYTHGGVIATILDEAMSKANRAQDVYAMTRHMEIEFLRPVPLDEPLSVRGRSELAGPRIHRCTAELMDERGHVLAQGTGHFVEVKPERLVPKGA